MGWQTPIDIYCERTNAAFWSEPLNALTNVAFVVAALVMMIRVRPAPAPLAPALCAILALIGVGSFLFHTFATRWAAAADILAILAFILLYLYAANRHFLALGVRVSLVMTMVFVPVSAGLAALFGKVPHLEGSAGYLPVLLLLAVYAFMLRQRAPSVAFGLAIGAGLFALSLALRTLDQPLCPFWPVGTHVAWHVLNAVVLAWMIEVYQRSHAADKAVWPGQATR